MSIPPSSEIGSGLHKASSTSPLHENLVNPTNAPSPALGQPSAIAPTVRVPTSLLPPLVVDLDGTLIKTDLLLESVCSLLRREPLALLALPI